MPRTSLPPPLETTTGAAGAAVEILKKSSKSSAKPVTELLLLVLLLTPFATELLMLATLAVSPSSVHLPAAFRRDDVAIALDWSEGEGERGNGCNTRQ